jgi:spore maturation protein A
MNFVWISFVIVGLGIMLFKNSNIAFSTILSGSEKAIALTIKLWAIYAVWLGILKIVEDTGLDKKLAKLLSPIIRLLFGKTDDYTKNQIAVNITSNLLGMGNASTPSGINAIAGLDKGYKYATSAMIMVIILNSTSLQLIPTTVIGLRITAGSLSASDVILPTLIATIASTIAGVLLVKLFSKMFKDKGI